MEGGRAGEGLRRATNSHERERIKKLKDVPKTEAATNDMYHDGKDRVGNKGERMIEGARESSKAYSVVE